MSEDDDAVRTEALTEALEAQVSPEAIIRAAELRTSLDENTAALNRVKARQVITSGALVALLLMTVFLGVVYWQVNDTQNDLKAAEVASCESGNSVREGLLHIADVLEDALSEPRADGRPRTEAEIAATRDFIAGLRADFALRDCGAS